MVCAGTKGTGCVLGVAFPFDCGPSGRVCSPDPAGYLCIGTDGPCAVTQKPSCQGATATYCAGGKLATMSCAGNAFRGACDPNGYVPCGPSSSQCAPDTFKGECETNRLVVCLDGRRTSVDCGALGFEICYPPNDKAGARCGFLMD